MKRAWNGFEVDVGGRVKKGLTEQEAWEAFLHGCNCDRSSLIRMFVGSQVVATRESMKNDR